MIHVIDITDGWRQRPIRRRKADGGSGIRLYDLHRDFAPRRIVLHQWAAEVSPASEAAARRLLGGRVYDDLAREHGAAVVRLAARAARVPYHLSVGVTDAGEGVVVQAWPLTLLTQHAGDVNASSIGVGVMGLFEAEVAGSRPPGLGEALREALRIASAALRGPGLPFPPVLHTHSQSTTKPADPGLWSIREGVAPLVRDGVLAVEPGHSSGSGRPWPASWVDAIGLA